MSQRTPAEIIRHDKMKLTVLFIVFLLIPLALFLGVITGWSKAAHSVKDDGHGAEVTNGDDGHGADNGDTHGEDAANEDGNDGHGGLALAAPALDIASLNGQTAGQLTLTGTGVPGTEVDVWVNGESVGTASVGEDGTWSLPYGFASTGGDFEIRAATLDPEGGESLATDPVTLSLNPALTAPTLDTDALGGASAGDAILSGTGTPGSQVEIVVNGEVVGMATVGENGTWTFPHTFAESGDYDISLRALDADGNAGPESGPFAVGIGPAIQAPTVDLPDPLVAGTFDLSGTGTPGSQVEIVVNGEVVGMATVGEDGTWTFPITIDNPGDYTLNLRAFDSNGNAAAESGNIAMNVGAPIAVVAPTLNPLGDIRAGESVELSGTGEPGAEVEIVVNGEVIGTATVGEDGTWTFPHTFADAGDFEIGLRTVGAEGNLIAESETQTFTVADALEPVAFSAPTADDDLKSGEYTFTGTGTPGQEIEILRDGEVIGTATVGDDGTWELPVTLEAGDFDYTAQYSDQPDTATDPLALSIADSSTTGTGSGTGSTGSGSSGIGASTGNAPPCTYGKDMGSYWVVGGCDTLTRISRTTGVDLTSILKANPDIVDPNIIFPNQRIKLPGRK